MEDLENTELDADLQEYTVAEGEYQQKFGRSLIIDLITLVNSQDLEAAVNENPELGQYIQENAGKFQDVAKDYMQSFIEEMPAPIAEGEEGMPTEEEGRPEVSANEEMM